MSNGPRLTQLWLTESFLLRCVYRSSIILFTLYASIRASAFMRSGPCGCCVRAANKVGGSSMSSLLNRPRSGSSAPLSPHEHAGTRHSALIRLATFPLYRLCLAPAPLLPLDPHLRVAIFEDGEDEHGKVCDVKGGAHDAKVLEHELDHVQQVAREAPAPRGDDQKQKLTQRKPERDLIAARQREGKGERRRQRKSVSAERVSAERELSAERERERVQRELSAERERERMQRECRERDVGQGRVARI